MKSLIYVTKFILFVVSFICSLFIVDLLLDLHDKYGIKEDVMWEFLASIMMIGGLTMAIYYLIKYLIKLILK